MRATDERDRTVAAALVARDRDLPALATLLDPATLADRVGAPVRLRRLRYKPATSVHAAVTVGDRWCLFAGYGPGGAPKLAKARAAARRRGHPVLLADDRDRWLVVPAPADRALPRRALAALGPGGTTIAYNPLRRLVVDGTAPDGPWVAKVYGAGPRPPDARLTAALVAAGVPTPPALPSHHPEVRRAVRWPGRPADPAADADEVAAAVAALAGARPDVPLPRWDGDDLLGRVGAALALVATVVPEEAPTAAAVDRALRRRAGVLAGLATVVVHGDLSPDQVVVGGRGAGLVDLDGCSRGCEGWDGATWLASQVATDGTDPVPLPGPEPEPTLQAAALALRAPEPFARQRPDWVAATRRMLTAAAALLDEGPDRS